MDRAEAISPPVLPHFPAGRIPALDGLRGCAIILVILFHSNVWFGGEFGGRGGPVSILFGAGWIGVDLFFVLSGFLITHLLLEDKAREDRRRFLANFYIRRILRIFPLYYGFLLLYLTLPRAAVFNNLGSHVPVIGVVSLLLFFYNFLAGFGLILIPTLHSFWSLCVEEHFYLLWPFLVWSLSQHGLMRLCLALAVFSLAVRLALLRFGPSFEIAYLITPCRLDGLALGAGVALALRHSGVWQAIRSRALAIGMAAAAGFLAIGAVQGHFKDNVDFRFSRPPLRGDSSLILGVGITLAAVLFCSLLVLALDPVRPSSLFLRVLEWRPLRSIGKYSFAMYVFHRLLFHISSTLLVKLLPNYDRVPPWLGKTLGGLWLIAVAYAAGWLSYHLYERHFLALKRQRTAAPPAEMPG